MITSCTRFILIALPILATAAAHAQAQTAHATKHASHRHVPAATHGTLSSRERSVMCGRYYCLPCSNISHPRVTETSYRDAAISIQVEGVDVINPFARDWPFAAPNGTTAQPQSTTQERTPLATNDPAGVIVVTVEYAPMTGDDTVGDGRSASPEIPRIE